MDFLKKAMASAGGDESGKHDQNPTSDHSSGGGSNADLMSSAKLVAEAAQAQFNHKPVEADKGELAGAAANLLDAAQKYGKLDEKQGVGQYVEKAEEYLRGYSHSQPHSSAAPAKEGAAAGEAAGVHAEKQPPAGESHETPAGGGGGDFMKMAGDFMKRE